MKEMRDVGWKEQEKGKKVDFLSVLINIASVSVDWVNPWRRYVDEVQDNLLIDTLSTFPPRFFTV